MSRNDLELTDRIIRQGRAIESLTTIDPFERAIAGLLVAAYKRRLRGVVELIPDLVEGEILSAGEQIGDDRAVPWMSEN